MARGKYETRAASRVATRDSEYIRQLESKLAERDRELHSTRSELAATRRASHSQAMNDARRLADDEIERCREQLATALVQHQAHIEALAFDLLDLYYEHGCATPSSQATEAFNIEYAELFGMSERYGEIWDYIRAKRVSDRVDDGNEMSTDRELARWESRFTSTTKKVRRANAVAQQMANGKGATQRGRGVGIGRAIGTWGMNGLPPR